MSHIAAQPTIQTSTFNPADAAEFARVRSEILPMRRRELSQAEFARPEYDGFRARGNTIPFLCRREWIPPKPQLLPPPGSENNTNSPVIIEYDPSALKTHKPEWTDDVQRAARKLLPRNASSFSEAIARTRAANDGALYNGLCYRLIAHRLMKGEGNSENKQPRLHLTFGVCRYFDYLNTTEILAHERAAGESRDAREAAGHWLGDLHRRHAGSGICALTFIRRANGELEFLMMDRSRSHVHTGLGLVHVRPAGEFQPVSENPDQFAEECRLWYILLRESAEEIGGVDMPRHFTNLRAFLAFDGIAAMTAAAQSGAWRCYYLGFGFDPLNYKPEFLLCSVIEEQTFRRLFPKFQADFAEGNGFQGAGDFGTRFSGASVNGFLTSPRLHPAAAACLRQAEKHRDFFAA
jgi:hypothetical protein